MDDNNFQSSLCITSMKQKLSGPTEAHGPFIIVSSNRVSKEVYMKKKKKFYGSVFVI